MVESFFNEQSNLFHELLIKYDLLFLFLSPEAAGVISSCIFLIVMFLFIPWPFSDSNRKSFPYQEVIKNNLIEIHEIESWSDRW